MKTGKSYDYKTPTGTLAAPVYGKSGAIVGYIKRGYGGARFTKPTSFHFVPLVADLAPMHDYSGLSIKAALTKIDY